MPTYDYICHLCGHEVEIFHSMNDAPLRDCPKCNKAGLKRKIGLGAGILFKGSGFYETDYKRKPKEQKESGSKKEGNSDNAKVAKASEKKTKEKKNNT